MNETLPSHPSRSLLAALRPHKALFLAQTRLLLTYRAAAMAGIVTQIVFGTIRLQALSAFLLVAGRRPAELANMADYIWLSQALLLLVPFRADPDLQQGIVDGRIAGDLLRPVDAFALWYARGLARRLIPTAMRACPLLLICWATGWLRGPESTAAALCCLLSLVCALCLATALSQAMSLIALWTVRSEGIASVLPPLLWFMSGLVLPLPLLPAFLQDIAAFLPFSGLIDTPIRLYLGLLTPAECPGRLLHQVLWIAALVWIGRRMTQSGLRRLTIAGA